MIIAGAGLSAGWIFPGPDVFFLEPEVAVVAERGEEVAIDGESNAAGVFVGM